MAPDKGFLSPRQLLVHGAFCCDGPSFNQLVGVLSRAQNLPASGQLYFCELSGLTDRGFQALDDITWPILEKFQDIGCVNVKDICGKTLDLSKAAKEDYDALFAALYELFSDPTNETLRDKVNQTIDSRLYAIGNLKDKAEMTTQFINDSTKEMIEYQDKLEKLSKALDGPDVPGLLREGGEDETDVQDDLVAVTRIQAMISGVNMKDQSGPSLSNLETLLGGIAAITADLSNLRQTIEEDAHPDDSVLLGVEKDKVLELWNDLRKEVERFMDQYDM
ncbi:hypothetical protein F4779DRAFT_619205 [Xylariaceae sp. FL0662B]|nr:hypothetical protein F4779DRAFT_619205 [Xylariaceae sp. FL0662B]